MSVSSKPEKFILDATAGFRMMWFNKKEPHTIYLDQRPECEPDIVGDFRDLKQFADETFRLIVFDPPHDVYHWNPNPESEFNQNFGNLRPDTWHSDLKKGLAECWRILRPMGVLLFKWNTHDIKEHRLLPLFPEMPLFQQITKEDYSVSSKKCKRKTMWFCFMKFPKDGEALG